MSTNIKTPARPTEQEPSARLRMAEKLWPEFKQWVERNQPLTTISTDDRKEWIDILIYEHDWDAFKFAKNMEGYVNANADLVDVLEGSWICDDVEVRQWVKDNDITPDLSIGDEVTFSIHGGTFKGIISDFNLEMAQYKVPNPSYEHGTQTYLVSYEEVTKV
jgi:hypothetical protein